jgi:hypothetical protein
MIRTRAGARRPAGRWAVVALLGAAVSLAGAGPAAAAEAELSSGSLTWGFKASFRAYLSMGDGKPPIAASNGASINANGTFAFPVVGGSYDSATGTGTARYGGAITFSYPSHAMNIILANPTIEVTGGTAALKADVSLNPGTSGEVSATQAAIATLSSTSANLVSGGSTVTGTAIPATLSEVGASVFNGFYTAGTDLDPISFTFGTAGGGSDTPAAPSVVASPTTGLATENATISVSGSGFDPVANSAAGIYVAVGPKTENHWLNSGVLQGTKWVYPDAPVSDARDVLNADGTFRTTLRVSARYTTRNGEVVDCTQVQCYLITFAAKGSADRSQDTFTPVTFRDASAGGDASQQINAVVTGGALTLSVAGSSVSLPAVGIGGVAARARTPATVSDRRGTNAGWSLVGQVENFTSADGNVIAADNLGWVPSASVVDGGATGSVTPGATANPGSGLGSARALCTAPSGASAGTFTCGARLNLGIPTSAVPGEYTATLTLTLS